jgi:Zn-dependent oligopeptidase
MSGAHRRGTNAMSKTTLASLQRDAARFGDLITIPVFEKSSRKVITTVDDAIEDANAELDKVAAQQPSAATFESTVVALDHILYPVVTATNRLFLIKETSTEAAVRKTATEQVQRLQDWFTETQYREDVYKACQAFEQAYNDGRRPRLYGEDLKLFTETMRDYRRAGLNLDAVTRAQVESLQKQLTALATSFDTNVTNADVTVYYTLEDLAGAPEFLIARAKDQGKTENGVQLYGIKATVTPQFVTGMQNLKSEAARKRLKIARYSTAQDQNTALLNELIRVRDQIAHLLSYDSWDDYKIEPKMAKTGARALAFLTDLKDGLEPKFRSEIADFAALKRAETGDPNATINLWDWRYYENQLKKQKYQIDTEALRVYFPLDRTLEGMFDVYEQIFSIRIDELKAPWTWYDDVTLHAVSDASTGEPLGLFYLDLFPREGKYNHFAQFDIIGGKQLANGQYQRPVCALVCNFTPGRGDIPSLMSHDEVETLFHEFGHAMHTILTRARYSRFAGTNVPRDFVEAPSQMLEAWVWDTDVLNRFAADYRDPSKKIDPGTLARMKEAKLATVATLYRRQLAFGFADLRMHEAGEYKDSQQVMNDALADVFFPAPAGTNMAAYWGHLTGYDAGYYGYAWADSIAADLATAFEQSPDGFLSTDIGRRLRDEIYATGGGRDVEKSIRAFLGRERSIKPFLKQLGIAEPETVSQK